MWHEHTLNKNFDWNWQYLALLFIWHVLRCVWMGWKGQRWGWPPSQPGGTVARGLHPQTPCGAGVSCPKAQPRLLPSKPWPEPGCCPKLHSQASYDVPGKVIFSVLWKSVLISSDACRFHTFLYICAILNIGFQTSWSYFNQQNQGFALVKTQVILPA